MSAATFSASASAVWHAIAGPSVRIPAVNSYVYYFLEGHVEHSSATATAALLLGNYSYALKRPMIPCQVLSRRFLADPFSDQVFVKFLLQPLQPLGPRHTDAADDDPSEDVVSFSKILTQSDVNNGGGFSVPRFCAELIFPPLDSAAEPPVQVLTLKDSCNRAWNFRHIYRGTPRRHLLTTGWSRFVNEKRLAAGDSIVFIRKKSTSELFIGVRKAVKIGSNDDGRYCGGEVVEAMEKVVKGMRFEVVYYPAVGVPDFVVKAEKVKEAVRRSWVAGMRVRTVAETEDGSRTKWYQGTVESTVSNNGGPWVASPWRMLKVAWDEAVGMQKMGRVNPWQVEVAAAMPLLNPNFQFRPSKKLKHVEYPVMMNPNGDGEGHICVPRQVPRLIGPHQHQHQHHVNYMPMALDYPVLPSASSIRGVGLARGGGLCLPTINANFSLQAVNHHQLPLPEPEHDESKTVVPTILSVASSYPDYSSSVSAGGSQNSSSVHDGGAEPTALGQSSTGTIGSNSFQLFGHFIPVPEEVGLWGSSKRNATCTDGTGRVA